MDCERYTCSNGVMVEHIDMGVEYSYRGKTLEIVGEQECGEVAFGDSDSVLGTYVRRGDEVTFTLEDGRVFTLDGCSEQAWEDWALAMLTESNNS